MFVPSERDVFISTLLANRRLRLLWGVLDVVDAHRFIWRCPRDERPVGLLHHHRGPTVVVAGLPDDAVTAFGLVMTSAT